MAQEQLTWDHNNNWYYAELEDGRTLYVNGDAFAEGRLEMARCFFAEVHSEMDEDTAYELFSETANEDGSEANECDTRAWNELIDPLTWVNDAVEVDKYGNPLDPKITWSFDAWIKKD